jgi:hypothetical protein
MVRGEHESMAMKTFQRERFYSVSENPSTQAGARFPTRAIEPGMEHGNSIKSKEGELKVIEAYKMADDF